MDQNNVVMWILVGALAALAVIGAIWFLTPKGTYITAEGIKIWGPLPRNAELIGVNRSQEHKVAELYRENRLFVFEGVSESGGVNIPVAVNAARTDALSKIAEFLSAKVETFRKRVEGQLQSVQTTSEKQKISEAAVTAYKGIEKVIAKAIVSGAMEYATWKVDRGNLVEIHVLFFYDPTNLMSILESQAMVSKQIKKLGEQGVDFFKALNDVLNEASKGTPMEENK